MGLQSGSLYIEQPLLANSVLTSIVICLSTTGQFGNHVWLTGCRQNNWWIQTEGEAFDIDADGWYGNEPTTDDDCCVFAAAHDDSGFYYKIRDAACTNSYRYICQYHSYP